VEVRDERVGDFEVVQTLSELNLALLTAAACLSPTAHSGGNLASLGIVGTLFMAEPIAAGQWHSCHVHLYTGYMYTQSLSFIPSIRHTNAQGHKLQTSDVLDAVLSLTCRPASHELYKLADYLEAQMRVMHYMY
jgi:hypothetical protein